MPMDEYENLQLEDSEEPSEPTAGAKELGLALARAITSPNKNGEAICEMVKKIVSEDY